MAEREEVSHGNLWLAEALWELGAIQFGDFNVGRTRNSPVYINLRRLVSSPEGLTRIATVIKEETETMLSMRNPGVQPFSLVGGVPFGGLHLATAISLVARVPMVYLHPNKDGFGNTIEGNFVPGQTVLIFDDLITGGSSIVETAHELREGGLHVRDAIVLVDRHQRGRERLRNAGIKLHAILELQTLLNYLMSSGKISEDEYRRSTAYLAAPQREE